MTRVSGIICALAVLAAGSVQAEHTLFYYHDKPPYVIDAAQGVGLYFDLLDTLNQRAGEALYTLRFVPRVRLERDLNAGTLAGAILGVNPIWFKDAKRERYLWTEPLYRDRDIVVSPQEKPFEYGQDSLDGLTVCQVRGYFYETITPAIQSGTLAQFPVAREVAIFDSLDQARCDFGVLSESLYRFLLRQGDIQPHYHIAAKPQAEYERSILVPKPQAALYRLLQEHLQTPVIE